MPQPTCIPSLETPTISLPEVKFVMPDMPDLNPVLLKYLQDMSAAYGNMFTQYNQSIQSMFSAMRQNNAVIGDRLSSVYQFLFNPENVEFNNITSSTINNYPVVSIIGFDPAVSPTQYSMAIPVAGAGWSNLGDIDLKPYGAEVGARFVFLYLYLGWQGAGGGTDDLAVAIDAEDDAHNYSWASGMCRAVTPSYQNGATIFTSVNTNQEVNIQIALGAGSAPVLPFASLYVIASIK